MRDVHADSAEPLLIGLVLIVLCLGSAWLVLAGFGWLGLSLADLMSIPASWLSLLTHSADPSLAEAGVSFLVLASGAALLGVVVWHWVAALWWACSWAFSLGGASSARERSPSSAD